MLSLYPIPAQLYTQLEYRRGSIVLVHVSAALSHWLAHSLLPPPLLINRSTLLSGLFGVLKLVSSDDLSFLKPSLDQQTRDSLQDLLDEYNRFNKFP